MLGATPVAGRSEPFVGVGPSPGSRHHHLLRVGGLDLDRSHGVHRHIPPSGRLRLGQKAAWVVFVIVLPFVGVLIYLIANHDGMAERSAKAAQAEKQQFHAYVRDAAGGSATEISKAKQLLDAGTINEEEFEQIKRKALAAA
jgi:uncharacterized membrane protein